MQNRNFLLKVFLSQLARHAGYVIDFTRVDPDDLMIATIQAAGGVDDFLRFCLMRWLSNKSEFVQQAAAQISGI